MDRQDTANGVGGGLAVYSVSDLTILPCDQAINFNQYSKFKIVAGCDVVHVYLVYRSPASGIDSKEQICELFSAAEKNSIFVGDFNMPDINWQTGMADSRASGMVLEAATAAGLYQLVDFPTHMRGNVLDLILTNIPDRISNVSDAGRIGRSDHVAITCDLDMVRARGEKIKVKNWKRADWDSIREEITNTPWPTTGDGTTTNEAWQFLRGKIDELTAKHVPEREFRESRAAWMTAEILQLIRKKRRLWKQAKHGQNVVEYENVAKAVNKKIRAAKRGMEQKLAKDKTGNKKPFYNYVRKKTRSKDTVGSLAGAGGQVIKDPAEMAEELNRCFSEVFTREDVQNIPRPKQHATRSLLNPPTARWTYTSTKKLFYSKALKPN
jgi:hypothetical protein